MENNAIETKTITLRTVSIFSVVVVIFCLGSAYNAIISRIMFLEKQLDNEKVTYENIIKQQSANEIALASIQTQLKSIDVTLVEIKNKIYK